MAWYTMVWVVLLGLGLLFELYALASKRRGDTLSEHVWGINAWAKKKGVLWLSHMMIIGACGWLLLHFTVELSR